MKTWKSGVFVTLLVAAAAAWYWWDTNRADPSAATGNGNAAAQSATGGRPGGGGRGGRGRSAALVVAAPVSEALINDRLRAVGSGAATASVSVVPLSSGILTEIRVSAGQRVERGDVLARLDDEEQLIARDRAARTAKDAATDEARLAQLYRSRTSTEVELNKARADKADADLALREAQLTLARRSVVAPIAGIVGLVSVDEGNYVTPQNELVTIDDRQNIQVEFWVPERFANQIVLNQPVEAIALADPGKTHAGVISAIGSRIDIDSRTLPVRARLNNDSDTLRPGMSFELQLSFPGQTHPAVNPLAIQWDSKGSYVWRIVEDKVERVAVKIIQRNPENVLVESSLAVGDLVVTEGLLSLRPGASIRMAGQRAQGQARSPSESGGKGQDANATAQDRPKKSGERAEAKP